MNLLIIGEHPLARDEQGNLKSRIGTVFPRARALVTIPGIHATQRIAYSEHVNRCRVARGEDPLTDEQQIQLWQESVDLIMENDSILIRPDPANMPLAFEADELLREIVPRQHVKFLHVADPRVREAIKRRGENWRINRLPQSVEEMKQMILSSRIGIGGREIYYYNKATGTRFLTFEEFDRLASLDDEELRRHLIEIQTYCGRGNRLGSPEIDFFMADATMFSAASFAGLDFTQMSPSELRAAYESLRGRFRRAVRPEFRRDDVNVLEWRRNMLSALINPADDAICEEVMAGLGSEFYLQIEWLPGGRIENGEFIIDPCVESLACESSSMPERRLAREFILNFMREYGDLEYINVGCVVNRLSQRPHTGGRRGVFIVEFKTAAGAAEQVHIIRMQKYGVRERLDEGKSLLQAIVETEEYTQYILDRRLGCRQIGMNLALRVTAGKVREVYDGRNEAYRGAWILSPYFQREYVRGIATDKIPPSRLENEAYALRLAHLLGRAAAVNMIVGRRAAGKVVFDDGDEVVIEDADGMPVEIVVADHTGSFDHYQGSLLEMAPAYAEPVNRRLAYVTNPISFAEVYLRAFRNRFAEVKAEYLRHREAFDRMVGHLPDDPAGNFPHRWRQVLQRLAATDPDALAAAIRSHMPLESLQPA